MAWKTKEQRINYDNIHRDRINRKRRERTANNPEYYRKKQRDYYARNKEHRVMLAKNYRMRLRAKIIKGYGGKCECCGESHQEFLALDHVNGGGEKERKLLKHLHVLYRKVIKDNFPSEYRLLCHNCNSSLGYYKYCPHNFQNKEQQIG